MKKFIFILIPLILLTSCASQRIYSNTSEWIDKDLKETGYKAPARVYVRRNIQVELIDDQNVYPKTAGLLHVMPGFHTFGFKFFNTGVVTSMIQADIKLSPGEFYYLTYTEKGKMIHFRIEHIVLLEDGTYEVKEW